MTQKDAEKIAAIVVKMIRIRDLTPELSEKVLDNLEILMKNKNRNI
jgi:hypothetical protein